MRFKMIINGVDFSPYIAEGGVTAKKIVRQGRAIVTMDGTLFRKQVVKDGYSVRLITLRDLTFDRLRDALSSNAVATVEYTDPNGHAFIRNFYITGPQFTVAKVVAGTTYYSGVGFELEAR